LSPIARRARMIYVKTIHPESRKAKAATMSLHTKHLAVLGTALTMAAAAPAQTFNMNTPQHLPTTQLTAGMYLITAQVADTEAERETGLMFRASMPDSEGMLFVFEQPAQQCFWMKNTLLPLSVAFIADDGRIVNMDEMKAQTLDSHCAAKPVRYVLEMNAHWFSKRGIKPGFKLGGDVFKKPAP
jgi:uncharacterized membrane protein (UPF0127 family)